MAKIRAKLKSKRKSLSQDGKPNKKKKTVIEEQSVRNNLNNGSSDNLQVQIRGKFEEELRCNICTEILIKPTVLNCSHMFCEYCITEWKKRQKRCPFCRGRIDSQIRLLALDVFIEKALEVLSPEETKARAAMISQRPTLRRSERLQNSRQRTTRLEKPSVRNNINNGSSDNFQVQIREKFEEELKCNICTEILKKPTVLNCSHMFCEYCITEWKKRQKRCPSCRGRIDTQVRLLALDVFIEKALEVSAPKETKARPAMISQRERKILTLRRSERLQNRSQRTTRRNDFTY